MSTYVRWDVVVVLVLMGVIFGFEMLGVFDSEYITLTRILKSYVPIPLRIMVLAWLCWHFAASDIVRAIQTGKPIQ